MQTAIVIIISISAFILYITWTISTVKDLIEIINHLFFDTKYFWNREVFEFGMYIFMFTIQVLIAIGLVTWAFN